MYVIKRDGRQEQVHFDKITARISRLAYGLNPDFCDPVRLDFWPQSPQALTASFPDTRLKNSDLVVTTMITSQFGRAQQRSVSRRHKGFEPGTSYALLELHSKSCGQRVCRRVGLNCSFQLKTECDSLLTHSRGCAGSCCSKGHDWSLQGRQHERT